MENTSPLGALGKKAVAWLVILAAAILALKLIVGAVLGFITMILVIGLVVAAVAAVMWALRHL